MSAPPTHHILHHHYFTHLHHPSLHFLLYFVSTHCHMHIICKHSCMHHPSNITCIIASFIILKVFIIIRFTNISHTIIYMHHKPSFTLYHYPFLLHLYHHIHSYHHNSFKHSFITSDHEHTLKCYAIFKTHFHAFLYT